MNDLICMAWQVTYQGGEGHKVLWGLWKFWRQEGVTGVRSRGEGSGLAGVRPVAAKEVALAPRTHTHQRFSCLQVCVLQARRSTRERLFAVMPSSLRVGPTMTHVHSLSGTMNKHQTKKAKQNTFSIATSLGYRGYFQLHDTLVIQLISDHSTNEYKWRLAGKKTHFQLWCAVTVPRSKVPGQNYAPCCQ